MVARLAEQSGIAADEFNAVLANPSQLQLPTWANGATEGFLFPETYVFDTEPTAVQILSDMTAHFNTVADQIDFVAKAEALGVSPYDAVTIASIIERETRDPVYGPDIAQVIYNRLAQGMPLQMDSTVGYAVNSQGGTVTTTDEERANPSPYNTYVHPGLPPGAISNPGKNCVDVGGQPDPRRLHLLRDRQSRHRRDEVLLGCRRARCECGRVPGLVPGQCRSLRVSPPADLNIEHMLRYLTAGESHGRALIATIEGIPAGVGVTSEDISEALAGRGWVRAAVPGCGSRPTS